MSTKSSMIMMPRNQWIEPGTALDIDNNLDPLYHRLEQRGIFRVSHTDRQQITVEVTGVESRSRELMGLVYTQ